MISRYSSGRRACAATVDEEARVIDRSRNRRSLMVHPALAIEAWDQVLGAGADMVCFDLEDGTAPSRKDEARRACLPCFARPSHAPVLRLLRINGPRTADGLRDILALLDLEAAPDGIVIPKVEHPQEVRWVRDLLVARHPQLEFVPLIETPLGARRATAIARAVPEISALFLGAVDYSGELGSDMGWDALVLVRAQLVAAAAQAGIDCIDGPWLDADDLDGLAGELERLAVMGFSGKCSYDAAQIALIHAAFTPSPVQIEHAQRLIAAVEASPTGSARVDGRAANKANAKAARRLLDRAARRGVM